jgi:hypothetical protein
LNCNIQDLLLFTFSNFAFSLASILEIVNCVYLSVYAFLSPSLSLIAFLLPLNSKVSPIDCTLVVGKYDSDHNIFVLKPSWSLEEIQTLDTRLPDKHFRDMAHVFKDFVGFVGFFIRIGHNQSEDPDGDEVEEEAE